MKAVWKYPLSPIDVNIIEVPAGGVIRAAEIQNNNPTLWIEIDSTKATEKRYFRIVPTGVEITLMSDMDMKFVGSVFFNGASLVFHIYEQIPTRPNEAWYG